MTFKKRLENLEAHAREVEEVREEAEGRARMALLMDEELTAQIEAALEAGWTPEEQARLNAMTDDQLVAELGRLCGG